MAHAAEACEDRRFRALGSRILLAEHDLAGWPFDRGPGLQRVASAAAEGSVAVMFAHRYLSEA